MNSVLVPQISNESLSSYVISAGDTIESKIFVIEEKYVTRKEVFGTLINFFKQSTKALEDVEAKNKDAYDQLDKYLKGDGKR